MKTLLVGEYREGKLLDTTCELLAFAGRLAGQGPASTLLSARA